MTNGNDRLDRVERILEQVTNSQEQTAKNLEQVLKTLQEMAERQQYHDEAFERHDAEMKTIREGAAVDTENIRRLARITDPHHRRLEDLEGGEPS